MALTYRSTKGSALTTDELDNNFRHFTGSHTVTGDLTVSGNVTGSFVGDGTGLTGVTGEWDGTHVGDAQITGSLTLSGSLLPNTAFNHDLGSIDKPWRELFISTGSLKFISTLGASPATASFNIQPNSTGELSLSGVYTGSFEGKYKGNGDLITSLKGVNTLIVTGSNASSILSGTTTMGGDPSAAQPGEGATTIAGGTLTVTSTNSTINSTNTTINSNTSISGSIVIEGETTLNGNTSISGSLTLSGSIIPIGDNIYDLGSTSKQWKELHATSASLAAISIKPGFANIQISGSTVFEDNVTVNNTLLTAGGIRHLGDTDTEVSFGDDSLRLRVGNIVVSDMTRTKIDFNLPITASSTISSSGIIEANQFEVDNILALDSELIAFGNGAATGRVFSDSNIRRIEIGRTGQTNREISLLGPVTASSTISASGNITAPTATLTNLSGGGTKFVTIDDDGVLKNSDGINVNISGSTTITGSLTISGSGTLTNIGPFNNTGNITNTGIFNQVGQSNFSGGNTAINTNTTVSGSLLVTGSVGTLTAGGLITGKQGIKLEFVNSVQVGTTSGLGIGAGKNRLILGTSDGTTGAQQTLSFESPTKIGEYTFPSGSGTTFVKIQKGFAENTSGGAINKTMNVGSFTRGAVIGITQTTSNNAVAYTLPAVEAGLEYTFIATATSTGTGTTTFSAPSAILKGMAICKDANEDISGTNFIFAAQKFEIGTRVHIVCDGTIYHITAICPCDVADVSTT